MVLKTAFKPRASSEIAGLPLTRAKNNVVSAAGCRQSELRRICQRRPAFVTPRRKLRNEQIHVASGFANRAMESIGVLEKMATLGPRRSIALSMP